MDGGMNGWMVVGLMDGFDRLMDGLMEGWTDGCMDGDRREG
jgi:hypothetical protein